MASTLQENGRKGTGTGKGTGVWLHPSIYASAQSQPSPKPSRTRGTRSRSAQQPHGSHTARSTHSVRRFLDLSSLDTTTSTTRAPGSWCSSYGSYQAFDASGVITDFPMGQTPPRSPYAAGALPGAPFLSAPFAGSDAPVRCLPDVNGPSAAMPFGQLASSAAYAPQECCGLAMPAACAPEQPCAGNSMSPYGMYGCTSTSTMALPQHSSMLAPASLPLQLLLPQQQLGASSQAHLPALSAAPAALGSFSQPLQASAATDSLSDALLLMQLQLQAPGGMGATSPVQDSAPYLAHAHIHGVAAEPLMGFDCQPLVPHVQAQGLMRLQLQLPAATYNPAGPACTLAMPTTSGALAAAEVSDCDGEGDLDMLSAVVDMKLELLLAMREELLAKRRMSAAVGAGMLR